MAWPRAVLFDLDGTLVDSAPAIADSLNQVIVKRGGVPVSVASVRQLISRGAPELVAIAFGTCATTPERDLGDFRDIYGALPPDPAHLYPGTTETLLSLANKGIRLGLCTNKPQGMTEKLLEGFGLRPLFGAVIGGDAIPRAKPHPDHLLATLGELGVMPADAIYVGDSEVDAEAAQRAGIVFILAQYGYALGAQEGISCRARIDCLDHLLSLLRNMKPHS